MPENQEPEVPTNRRKVFFGLFVFPMLIAVTMAVLLSGVVLLTHEEETPESLITAIKTGAPSKRWQKAFELANELARPGSMIRSAGVLKEAIHILGDRDHYDARTRAYMAMAVSKFGTPEAEQALTDALRQVEDQDDPTLPLFIMWGLGNAGDPGLAPAVKPFLQSQSADLRKTAAYVLGVLGNREARGWLAPLLEDAVIDVRWNAALALARLDDDLGREVLLQMLDRHQLLGAHRLAEPDVEKTMVNAVRGLALVKDTRDRDILEKISKEDPNLKVREAALAALQNI